MFFLTARAASSLYRNARKTVVRLYQTQQNLFFQVFGQGLGKAFTLAYSLMLPKWVGAEAYGIFAFCYAVTVIFIQPAIDLGLDFVIVKKASRGDARIVKEALLLRAVGTAIAGIFTIATSLYCGYPFSVFFALYLYAAFFSFEKVCFSYNRGQERMQLEGVLTLVQRAMAFGILFWLFHHRTAPLLQGPISLMVAAALTWGIAFYSCRHWLRQSWQMDIDWFSLRQSWREGLLLMGTSLLAIAYFRIDTVMLGLLQDLDTVAHYNVAYRLIEGTIYFPSIVTIVFFPKLVKVELFSKTFKQLLAILAAMGVVLLLAVAILAQPAISTLYGAAWSEAVPLLQTLAWSLLPICLGHLGTQSLIALDLQHLYFAIAAVAVVLNVGLNFVAIPAYGAIGAAWATTITESFIVLSCFLFVWRWRCRGDGKGGSHLN